MIKRHLALIGNGFLLICLGIVLSIPADGIASAKEAADRSVVLPEELNGIVIEERFVPLDADVIGTVQSVRGRLIIRHGRGFSAYYATAGDRLYERDILYTLEGGRTRIALRTADVITLGENSRISVDQFEDDRQAKKKRSVFSILRGKAMFYAVRLFRYRSVTTEVHTQTAVVGVRGTKFGVQVEKAGDGVASDRPVYLADASGGTWPGLLAQNGGGEGFETTVYGFDGDVAVTSTTDNTTQTVTPGENVSVGPQGAGPVTVTPPGVARRFSRATDAPPPETSGGADGGDDGGGAAGGDAAAAGEDGTGGGDGEDAGTDGGDDTTAGAGDTATAPAVLDADAAVADVSQNETSQVIADEVVSGTQVGYFTALLTGSSGSTPNLADIYINTSRNDFDDTSVKGVSIVNSDGYITASGTGSADESAPYLTRIRTAAGSGTPGTPFDSGELGTTRQMDNPDLSETSDWPRNDTLGERKYGENTYMEWGFWRMSRWVPGNAITPFYAITDRAYYVNGVSSPDAAVAGISGVYAGSAWGTYFSGNGGIDMVGTFSCDIDVPNNSVSNFDMSVSGGNRSAGISNGTGSFVGSSGEFKIVGGDWALVDASTTPITMPVVTAGSIQGAASASCTGSLFGTNGENVGGVWAMDAYNGNNAAVGIFVGDKGGAATTPSVPATLPAVSTPGGQ
ncbi:MAG: FecR domain-containing protein [Desulfobacterales bacterium]|nr:FecR domain-containing protein [Desulfobacterales bacterium]